MSLITLTTIASVLKASGVTADAILEEAGLSREEAIAALSKELGIKAPEGAVEVTDAEVRVLREALAIQSRILS